MQLVEIECKNFKDHELKQLWYYSQINKDYRASDLEYCAKCKAVFELTERGYLDTGAHKLDKFMELKHFRIVGDLVDIEGRFP